MLCNFFIFCSERLKVHEDSDDGTPFIPQLIVNTKHHVFTFTVRPRVELDHPSPSLVRTPSSMGEVTIQEGSGNQTSPHLPPDSLAQ